MHTKNKDLEMPSGLSPKGKAAYETIMKLLEAEDMTDTGGCKAFYSPAEWEERGERYGKGCALIVVYDGGDLCPFFNSDYDYHFVKTEKMLKALSSIGVFAEQMTCWSSAIYLE